MNNVNKTLYIPLYGKALISKRGIILSDKHAENIWENEAFSLKRKSRSKWLAFYMGMRSAVFDKWLSEKMKQRPDSVVLHLGCGMDSRIERVGAVCPWFDIDFDTVISERRRYFSETELYKMLGADIRNPDFLSSLPEAEWAIVVMEGVSMYLKPEELRVLLSVLYDKYRGISLLVDCYSPFAAKMSKIKNPVNDVGVTDVYGIASPSELEMAAKLRFVREGEITPTYLVNELSGFEKFIFSVLYAGSASKKLYKLYEYESE